MCSSLHHHTVGAEDGSERNRLIFLMSLGPPSWPEDIHRSLKYVLEKEKQSPSRAVKM